MSDATRLEARRAPRNPAQSVTRTPSTVPVTMIKAQLAAAPAKVAVVASKVRPPRPRWMLALYPRIFTSRSRAFRRPAPPPRGWGPRRGWSPVMGTRPSICALGPTRAEIRGAHKLPSPIFVHLAAARAAGPGVARIRPGASRHFSRPMRGTGGPGDPATATGETLALETSA